MTDKMTPNVADVQQKILMLLKQQGEATTAEMAGRLDVSYEAVRQQVKQLEGARLIERRQRPNPAGVGRPLRYYVLSGAGDHLFPKNYDELAVELIDSIAGTLGSPALRRVLASLTDAQVREWASRLEGLPLEERLQALEGFYIEGDPFTEVSRDDGVLRLVERNCPFLNVASRRPALCSVTVSTLTRLLGYRVTREKRFQDGDGRCVFRVHTDRPVPPEQFRFEFEDE